MAKQSLGYFVCRNLPKTSWGYNSTTHPHSLSSKLKGNQRKLHQRQHQPQQMKSDGGTLFLCHSPRATSPSRSETRKLFQNKPLAYPSPCSKPLQYLNTWLKNKLWSGHQETEGKHLATSHFYDWLFYKELSKNNKPQSHHNNMAVWETLMQSV